MADGVGWKTVELQIETLVPGVLLVLGANAAADQWFATIGGPLVPRDGFVQGALFVAVAYAAGVLGAIPCRAAIDRLSEAGVRAWIFSRFAHADCKRLLRNRRRADEKFRTDYYRERRVRCSKGVAFWNAVYRSGLRTVCETRRIEVDRRRSQGRVLRNLALALAVWVAVPFPATLAWKTVGAVLGLIVFLMFVVPYAYWEYVIFAEAHDISS